MSSHLNDLGRQVNLTLLRDGSGRVCIHWFERRDDGPITTPKGAIQTRQGFVPVGGVRGRIACQPERKSDLPFQASGVTQVLCRSDDVRAVTCPKCRALKSYWEAMVAVQDAAGVGLSDDEAIMATAAGASLKTIQEEG